MMKNIYTFLCLTISCSIFAYSGQPDQAQQDYITNSLASLEPGAVFRMNFDTIDSGELSDGLPMPPIFTRQISNYGLEEIYPNRDHKYQVVEITDSIPNGKGNMEGKKFLLLKRQEPAQIDDQGIFWYVNAEGKSIESFEDGHHIADITNIKVYVRAKEGKIYLRSSI